VTPVARAWIEGMADALPRPQSLVLRTLLDPRLAEVTLRAPIPQLRLLDRALRNTVSPTIIHGGEKINVIPSQIDLELDGRLLPGFEPEDIISEIHTLVGPELELEVIRHDPYPAEPDLSQLPALSAILRDEVRPISEVAPDVPPQLDTVIQRCMRKNPDDRWQSMTEVRTALSALKRESDSGALYTSRVSPRTTAGTARVARDRGRLAGARPRRPRSELCPQLGGPQDLRAELGVGRHEIPHDAQDDLGLVAQRAEDLVALEQRLPARPGVHGEVAIPIAPLAEKGVRLLDRVAHGWGSS